MDGIALDQIPLTSTVGACTVCARSADEHGAAAANARSHNPRISGRFSIVKCESCGAHYLRTRLVDDDLAKCYGGQERHKHSSNVALRSSSLLKRAWHSVAQKNPLLDLIDGGPVLDCGCGAGSLLSELRQRGVDARGIEFIEEYVEFCRSLGLSADQADLSDYVPDREAYKYIVLSHVLEHVPDPSGLLKRLATGLKPDGAILILVPNVDSALRWVFGSNWNGWDAPYHLTHFSRRSLTRIAEREGLRVTLCRTVGTSDELRRCLINATGWKGKMLTLRIASEPAFKLLARFGAGSQLLARLSRS